MDNSNIQLIQDLEGQGAQFIACGQDLHFMDIKKESRRPQVKVSLTAKTVLSS